MRELTTHRYTNFLGGSPLNRLSWLRTSPVFLNAIASAPAARWVLFQNGHPLMASNNSRSTLARLPTSPLLTLLGPAPLFGQGKSTGDTADEGVSVLEAARLRGPPIVFLGLEEPKSVTEGQRSSAGIGALPSSEFSAKESGGAKIADKVEGTPFFALDVSAVSQGDMTKVLEEAKEDGTLEFTEPRAAMSKLDFFDAALFSEARSMLDWNTRNRVSDSVSLPLHVWKIILDPVLSQLWLSSLLSLGRLEARMLIAPSMG
jgi:NAD+ diphosphatase